jgi:hypothetical protein
MSFNSLQVTTKYSIHSKTLTLKTANRSTHKANTTLRKVLKKKWMTQKIQIKIETLNSPSMKNFTRGKKNQNPET